MRLYLGLDNVTALTNEIAKVKIHYLPHYDLIKLHRIIFISPTKGSSKCGLFPLEAA